MNIFKKNKKKKTEFNLTSIIFTFFSWFELVWVMLFLQLKKSEEKNWHNENKIEGKVLYMI